MKKDVNILLEKILKESVYSIEDIQKAIDTQTPMTVNKTKINNTGSSIATFNVVPEEIDGDIIIGKSDEQGRVEFKLEEVEQILFLNEGIKISMKQLGNIDTSALEKVAEKSDVEITEAEEPEEGDHVFDYIKRDVKGEDGREITTEEFEQDSLQELSIFNIKNWAEQLKIDLGDIHNFKKGVVAFTFIEDNQPYTILIYADGTIHISGHTVRSFEDFKKVIDFTKIY